MDMIAARLGMSKRTLYENFKEKNELLLACLEKAEDDRNVRLKTYYAQRQIHLYRNFRDHIQKFYPGYRYARRGALYRRIFCRSRKQMIQ